MLNREGRTTPTPETALKKQVCKTLDQLGIFWLRIQSGKVKVRGGWMQLAPNGTADLFIPHITLWVETKATTGQSDDQKAFQARAESWGHRYLIVRSLGELMEGLG